MREITTEDVRVVKMVAFRFAQRLPAGVDEGAFEGAALESLARSAQLFDGRPGIDFRRWAVMRAWNAMQDEARRMTGNSRNTWAAYKNGEEHVVGAGNRWGGKSKTRVQPYVHELSTSLPVGEDGLTLEDQLEDHSDPFAARLELADVKSVLPNLNARERFCLFGHACGLSDEELAGYLGVSFSRVSQLRTNARSKINAALAEAHQDDEVEYVASSSCLSPREVAILRLLAEGKRPKEIAFALRVGVEGVRSSIAQIRRKLGAKNAAHAVTIAWRTTDVLRQTA